MSAVTVCQSSRLGGLQLKDKHRRSQMWRSEPGLQREVTTEIVNTIFYLHMGHGLKRMCASLMELATQTTGHFWSE